MRSDFGALLDQHHGRVRSELLEMDGSSEPCRPGADNRHVEFHRLARRQCLGAHLGVHGHSRLRCNSVALLVFHEISVMTIASPQPWSRSSLSQSGWFHATATWPKLVANLWEPAMI